MPFADDAETRDSIWRFVRGDSTVDEFRHWAYGNAALERLIGDALYLEVLSADYGVADVVDRVREQLNSFARSSMRLDCQCIALRDLDVVDMGDHDHVFDSLVEARHRGAPYWWLSTYACTVCGQAWLVAQEERQNDIFCMRRMSAEEVVVLEGSGVWPTAFDTYEALLRIGYEGGRSVRFPDPMDSSLRHTMSDLARSRPGISLDELAVLLNLDVVVARAIALTVIRDEGVHISLRSPQSN